MRELIEVAPALFAVIFMTAIFYVLIDRNYVSELFRSVRARLLRLPQVLKFLIALLLALAIYDLFRELAEPFIYHFWAAPTEALLQTLEPKDLLAVEDGLRTNRIQLITTAIQFFGGIAVLFGIYFAWANLKHAQKAQEDTQKNQAETLRLTNEGQITDRFIRAIDQLGSGQLEIRLGAIYALERIARDSEKDHWPIMEILTAYVRVHAPIEGTGTHENAPAAKPDPDIQAILTVIGRRNTTFEIENRVSMEHPVVVDLRGVNLEGVDLSKANLDFANLSGADLSGADMGNALLFVASLIGTMLEGTDLNEAYLASADLSEAVLAGADLRSAYLESAKLGGANLSGANLHSADLTDAYMTRADLSGADLTGTDLSEVDLSEAIGLTQQQIDSATGDEDTKLPPGLVMPDSWKNDPDPPIRQG